MSNNESSTNFYDLPEKVQLFLRDHQENPRGHERKILSVETDDQIIVNVGSRILSFPKGITFHECLVYYSVEVFGKPWFREQGKLPKKDWHPIFRWYEDYATTHKRLKAKATTHYFSDNSAGPIAYLHLSHDLYLLEHHGLLTSKMLKRLKNSKEFQGVRYEIYVLSVFLRAGFRIEMLEPKRKSDSHCEFNAFYDETSFAFTVEAKSRRRPGIMGHPGDKKKAFLAKPDIGKLLFKALQKPAQHMRMVFIDVNVPNQEGPIFKKNWVKKIITLVNCEEKEHGDKYPPAVLIFTSHPYDFSDPEDVAPCPDFLMTGINIPEFKVPDLKAVELKFPELMKIWESINRYNKIPATFS